jgi:hypothetical protein
MSVMEKYVPRTHTLTERSSVPLPQGTGLGQLQALELFENVPQQLALPFLGYFLKWAEREGDLQWREVSAPLPPNHSDALALYALTDQQVRQAEEIAFGDPLPFVAIVTQEPLSATAVEQMWKKTAFAPYETIAIFKDGDPEVVPRIYFLHWGQRIDMANAPQHVEPLESAALQYNGQLVWAAQTESIYGEGWRIGPEGSRTHWPTLPFSDALAAQLALTPASAQPGAPPAPPPQIVTQTTVAPATPSFWSSTNAPIIVGFGAAALAFFWVRKRQEQR